MLDAKKVTALRAELRQIRSSPNNRRSAALIAIAKKVGRKVDNRGKEPTYVRNDDPALSPPLSIPNHTKDLKPMTVKSIVDTLLSDLDDWDIYINEQDKQ